MERYIINENAKSKLEEKQIYQLGSPELLEKYIQGRNIRYINKKIIKPASLIAIAMALGGLFILHNHTVAFAGFGLMAVLIIFNLLCALLISGKQHKAVSLSPDIKQMADSYGIERLNISPQGVSHIFLKSKGNEDSSDRYVKKEIDISDISEILRCEALGVYIFCGHTSGYIALQNDVVSVGPSSVEWEDFSYCNQTSLRVYDYWKNQATGEDDIKRAVMSSFSIPIREISLEEAAEIIRRDEKRVK